MIVTAVVTAVVTVVVTAVMKLMKYALDVLFHFVYFRVQTDLKVQKDHTPQDYQ